LCLIIARALLVYLWRAELKAFFKKHKKELCKSMLAKPNAGRAEKYTARRFFRKCEKKVPRQEGRAHSNYL